MVNIANTGFYVKDLNLPSIRELLENRMFLERYAAFLAIQRIVEEEIERLHQIAVEMRTLAEKDDEYELVMKDMQFHSTLVKAAKNHQLETIMSMIYNESLRVWFISHYEEINESVQMHFKIIEMLKQNNWNLPEREIIHHNNVFRERLEGYFKNFLKENTRGKSEFRVGTPTG